VNAKDGNSRAGGVQGRGDRSPEPLLGSRSRIDRRKKRFPAGSYGNRNLEGLDDLSYSSEKLSTLLSALGETETWIHHDRIGRNAE
jgi:hypothetical protein